MTHEERADRIIEALGFVAPEAQAEWLRAKLAANFAVVADEAQRRFVAVLDRIVDGELEVTDDEGNLVEF